MAQYRPAQQLFYQQRIGTTVSVAYTAVAARTATILGTNPGARVRLVVTTDAYVRQGGSSVTATTSDMPLYIGQEFYAVVIPNALRVGSDEAGTNGDRFSAIRQTADGTLYVTDVSRIE